MNTIYIIKNKYNEFAYGFHKYDVNIIHPIIEYKRTKIINDLIDYLNDILKKFKFSLSFTELNTIIRYFLIQNNNDNDPVIPIKDNYNIEILDYILKRYKITNHIDEIKEQFTINIIPYMKKLYDTFKKYYDFGGYKHEKYDIIINYEQNNIIFYYDKVETIFYIDELHLEKLNKRYMSNNSQYYYSKDLNSSFNDCIIVYLFRYDFNNLIPERYNHNFSILTNSLFFDIIKRFHIDLSLYLGPSNAITKYFSYQNGDINNYFNSCGTSDMIDLYDVIFISLSNYLIIMTLI